MSKEVDRNDIRQKMIADDMNYHAERLGLGAQGIHEGWIQAEEARASMNADMRAETRHHMIAVGAFYLAEKRGFTGNGIDEDWIKAEAEIDAIMQDQF